MMAHDELTDLLSAYALDALPEDDRAAVGLHLQGCSVCVQSLRELQAVTQLLPLAADEHDAPGHLRDRVLAAARQAGAQGTAPPAVVAQPAARSSRRWGWVELVAAAAMVLALGLAGWNVALQREVGHLRQEVAQQRATVWLAKGNERAPAASAELSYLPDRQVMLVHVTGLPRPKEGRVYKLWVIQNGQPADRGTPPLGASGELRALLVDNPKSIEQFVITDEAAPGGPQPLGPAVLVAPIRG